MLTINPLRSTDTTITLDPAELHAVRLALSTHHATVVKRIDDPGTADTRRDCLIARRNALVSALDKVDDARGATRL